ncbi:MAG: hydantoinase/oxoprolinase family protein, partial [Deltaproteobacteria bacterium]|nr:hydantoinase/oxoprolinase family protein [Deltaproteobacteria bacterium]
LTTLGEVKGYPIKTPFLDIKTIGAGGGSIAWLDGKNLRVGPISAGADPGPACYGKGGEEPTITDANLVLGRLNPDRELGEEIRMNKELSIKAIEKIAKEFPGYDVIKMANGIIKIVINNMAMAIHEISVQKGYDPREFVLVAFGGAGPLHAAQLAKELGMKKVLVPNIPGNLCALGLLASDTMINQVRTHIVKTREVDVKEIEDIFADMLDEAYKSFKDKGIAKEDIQFIRYMDMRYIGQAFEIHVPISNPITQESLEKAFYDQYEMTYGYADRKEPTEIVNIRVSALYRNPRPALSTEKSKPKGNPNWNTRKVFFEDTGFIDCKVAERDLLPYEIEFEGPAIIEEFGSTTVVLPNQKAKIDDLGNILIEV